MPREIDEPIVVSSVAFPSVSVLALFEEVLMDAVRQQATDVCLLPHPNGQTDVYYQIEHELKHQRVIDHIPARTETLGNATPDPTRPDVHALMPALNLAGFELRYAPESEILHLLIEAFPLRYNHLRGLSGVTKDFLAAVYPETEEAFAEMPRGIDEPIVVSSVAFPSVSVLALFEEVLMDAVRQQATDVCLLPHPNGQTDVYYQIEHELKHQRVIDHIPARMFISAIKNSVFRTEDCAKGTIEKRLIQRWIDDTLVRFRISVVPASEEVHSECIVVRVSA